MRNLPIPNHFDSTMLESFWRVDYLKTAANAEAWAEQHNISPAANDKQKVYLLLVDLQNTFCIPGFGLFVDGAPDDNRRVCEFIYRNLDSITKIAPTMDTHTVMQIFHPFFWVNDAGKHPDPATQISADDVRDGVWKVNVAVAGDLGNYTALCKYALHYVKTLESDGKFMVTAWPYHAMLGGIGHALVSSIEEALFFHNIARHSQTSFQIKGGNSLTENYSVLRPEILTGPDGNPIAQKNTRFIKMLLDADMVIIAGQAKSHCVAWTIDDLLTEIQTQDPALTEKVYLLEDCTSPVVIPGVIDFTDQANEAFQRFSNAGMHLVKSTDSIDSWPNI